MPPRSVGVECSAWHFIWHHSLPRCSWEMNVVLGGTCSLSKAGTCPSGKSQGWGRHGRWWEPHACCLLLRAWANIEDVWLDCWQWLLSDFCWRRKSCFTNSDFRSHLTFTEEKGYSPTEFGPKFYLLHGTLSTLFYCFVPNRHEETVLFARPHLSPFCMYYFVLHRLHQYRNPNFEYYIRFS